MGWLTESPKPVVQSMLHNRSSDCFPVHEEDGFLFPVWIASTGFVCRVVERGVTNEP